MRRLLKIVCRTGDPVTLADLRKVSAAEAKSIVILADYSLEPDMSDARAVRCVLALKAGVETKADTTVELRDIDNRPTLELVSSMQIGGDDGKGGKPLNGENGGAAVEGCEAVQLRPGQGSSSAATP